MDPANCVRPDPRFLSLDGLPYPHGASGGELTRERAGALLEERWLSFVDRMPAGTRACFDAHVGFVNIQDDFRSSKSAREPWRILNYLVGDGPLASAGAGEAGLRRRQFIVAHPVLSTTALVKVPVVAACIDGAAEITPVLAVALGTEERVIRALARIPAETCKAARDFLHTSCGLRMLEGMAPSWLAAIETMPVEAWEALGILSNELGKAYGGGDGLLGGDKPRASWDYKATQALGRHLGSTLAPDGDGSLLWLATTRNVWGHLQDVAKGMARELILPALARNNGHALITDRHIHAARNALLTLGVRKLARCLAADLAGAVHDARLGLAIGAGGRGDGWGEAAPPVNAPGGQVLRFLSSQAELSAEGAAMSHCVGSYGQSCADRSCAIMSIGRWEGRGRKERNWIPSSTAEVRVDANGMPWLQQHYGHGNGRAPLEDRNAAAWWLAGVRDERIRLVPGAIQYRMRGSPSAEDLPWLLGAAWRTPEAQQHRWDRWRRLLGARPTRFGDWLLALPPVFFACHPCNPEICTVAVDMDDEMDIARDIADMERGDPEQAVAVAGPGR